MKRIATTAAAALLLAGLAAPAMAVQPADPEAAPANAAKSDSLPHPLGEAQDEARQQAIEAKLQGKLPAGAKVAKVGVNKPSLVGKAAKGQYVKLEQTGNDRVFVILAEFGDSVHPSYGGSAGPLHNQIAQPNRADDNTTIWQSDFNVAHYRDMYFNKMAAYYQNQSSGRYTINGDVMEWVKVPFNEARYGSNNCGSNVCSTAWYLIRDAINAWTANQVAAGKTPAQIRDYLKTFDVQDRYDIDGDGNFSESDGYIDHFQIVHAGEGEETGGGAQGSAALWSHRWYTAYQGIGNWGPTGAPLGGMEFGGQGTFGNLGGPNATGVWVGDYTMQPENGGLGVFAHEFAHDLGLPDQYDTVGGENSTAFWTIMSSGSYLGDGSTNGLGTNPGGFNAWEKLQLGWLNYEVAQAGKTSSHKIGPMGRGSKQAQAAIVVLPDKQVVNELGTPTSGSKLYYSGSGDDLNNTMTRQITLPAAATLSAKVNYQIELDWDYAYLTVNGTPVATNLSTAANPNGQNSGFGITGTSNGWVNLTADLSSFAGQSVTLGFRYWTDGAVAERGLLIDDIAITGQPLDDAESVAGWTFTGFKVSTGSESQAYLNAYIAENRQYLDYDLGLKTGPYNFGFLNSRPDWVEHFPYQDGLLVSYWDTSYTDNNTTQHPGAGLILPVDARPEPLLRPNGTPWRARVQSYDSTFGLQATDAVTLHINGVPSTIASQPAAPVFDDSRSYWNAATPLAGVKVPNTGTTIRVVSETPGGFTQIVVAPK